MIEDKNIGVTGFGDLAADNGAKLLNLEWVAKVIAHEIATKQLTERVRAGEETAKKQMRCVLFHAVMNGKRCQANTERLTGYLCLDFDDAGVDYVALREELAKDNHLQPVLMFTSPRGKLKCVVYCKELDGLTGKEMAKAFAKQYMAVSVYVKRMYGLLPDTSCMDISRNCFLSHDPQPYLNPNGCLNGIEFDKETLLAYARMKNEESGTGNAATNMRFAFKDFDKKAQTKYDMQLRAYRKMLTVGDDGDWEYERNKKVFIGSRHKGTAKIEIDGLSGYDLKWRILEVAYWLYGDKDTAQKWVERHFTDAWNKRDWTPINDANTRILPKINVLRWVLREFGFLKNAPRLSSQGAAKEKKENK